MFLTKEDLDEALRMAEIYGGNDSTENKIKLAEEFAREIFTEYDELDKEQRQDAIDMILDDMSMDIYNLN